MGSAAEAAVEALVAGGVGVVFGVPGVHNLPLFDALARSPVRVVLARHEGAAAHAADGFARAAGRPGVVLTTTGPGAANTLAATGEAWAASSPVLHLTTQVASAILADGVHRRTLHQSPAQLDSFAPLVKAALRPGSPDEVAAAVAGALAETGRGRPGPCYVEVPFDLLRKPGAAAPPPQTRERRRIPAEEIERAAEMLAAAASPVVWAGGGVVRAGATAELAAIAERLAAPVVTTFMGRGALPDDHPLALGLPPHEPRAATLLERADVLLAVGTDLDGTVTQNQRLPLPARILRVDLEARPPGAPYPVAQLLGDAADALAALDRALERRGLDRRGDVPRVAEEVRATRRVALDDIEGDPETSEAAAFLGHLAAARTDDTVVVVDMCVAGYWIGGYLPVPGPRRLLYPVGWGTLGFGLPAGVGAALARPGPTLAVVGDAGLMYYLGELATARQEDLDLVVLTVNDGGYGMLRYDQERSYGHTFAADLQVPDLDQIARGFGVPYERVALGPDLERALASALRAGGEHLIELRAAFVPPRTTSPRWPTRA